MKRILLLLAIALTFVFNPVFAAATDAAAKSDQAAPTHKKAHKEKAKSAAKADDDEPACPHCADD